MQLVSIVPRLFPSVDGVGDYALNLARQLRTDFEVKTRFIVADPTWEGSSPLEGFMVDKVAERSPNALLTLLRQGNPCDPVLLQFSGYGYAKWALAFWLLEGLNQWKQEHSQAQLLTMFHELYNSLGLPWQHNFWTYLLQKNLATRLMSLSDVCLTNTSQYAKRIELLSHSKHHDVEILPVISNVGELKQIIPFSHREPRLIIFGQSVSKLRTYQESLPMLAEICKQLKIQEIWDIGPSSRTTIKEVNKIPIVEKGRLPTIEISQILERSRAGFVNYNLHLLGKSGIFAAYCAHGVLPVTQTSLFSAVDGLVAGVHYWTADLPKALNITPETLQAITSQAYIWYQFHNLESQAKALMELHFVETSMKCR